MRDRTPLDPVSSSVKRTFVPELGDDGLTYKQTFPTRHRQVWQVPISVLVIVRLRLTQLRSFKAYPLEAGITCTRAP